MGPRTDVANWGQLYKMGMAESGMTNAGNPTDPQTGKPLSSASGYWQIIKSTWDEGQDLAGIPKDQQTGTAQEASYDQQKQVAMALLQNRGTTPWSASEASWGQGGKYANIQVPDEASYSPSLGQATTAQAAPAGAQDQTAQADPYTGLTNALNQTANAAAQQQQRAQMTALLQKLQQQAAVRKLTLQPVSYDPYKVWKAGQMHYQDIPMSGMTRSFQQAALQPTAPSAEGGVMATAPALVPGRLGRRGPPGQES